MLDKERLRDMPFRGLENAKERAIGELEGNGND